MAVVGSGRSGIAAVIVTWNPAPAALRRLVEVMGEEVERTALVDNGSGRSFDPLFAELERSGCRVERLASNRGIGAAQNIGLAGARADGCEWVLFLDQDSTPPPGLVTRLRTTWQRLAASGEPVAAVGPVLVDARTGVPRHFLRIRGPRLRRIDCSDGAEAVETDFLASSGTLASLHALDGVGPFDDSLFIDNVDLDWCFRARAAGWRLFGDCGARMSHRIGSNVMALRRGRAHLYIHEPRRQYYITRNRILLYRRWYTPFGWVIHDLLRALVRVPLFVVYAPEPWQHLRWMARGLVDGVRQRRGSLHG